MRIKIEDCIYLTSSVHIDPSEIVLICKFGTECSHMYLKQEYIVHQQYIKDFTVTFYQFNASFWFRLRFSQNKFDKRFCSLNVPSHKMGDFQMFSNCFSFHLLNSPWSNQIFYSVIYFFHVLKALTIFGVATERPFIIS